MVNSGRCIQNLGSFKLIMKWSLFIADLIILCGSSIEYMLSDCGSPTAGFSQTVTRDVVQSLGARFSVV